MIKVIKTTNEMEEIFLNTCSKEDGILTLKLILKETELEMAEEYIVWLYENLMELIQKKYNDPMLINGFVTSINNSEELRLIWYGDQHFSIYFTTDEINPKVVKHLDDIRIFDREYYRRDPESEITIPTGISEIGRSCFSEFNGIRKVIIPKGIKTICSGAFLKCRNLEEVSLPDTLISIEDGAFSGCQKLKHIELPESLKTIGSFAFYGCENLRNITLPFSIEKIGYGVFVNCKKLMSVIIPDNLLLPYEKHIFLDCPKLNFTRELFSQLSKADETILSELQDALNIFAQANMNGINISYYFYITKIDKPEINHIRRKIDESLWVLHIRDYLNHNDWVALNNSFKYEGILTYNETRYLQRIIIDTLRSIKADIYQSSDEGLMYYEEKFHCMDLISIQFLHINGNWYAMTFVVNNQSEFDEQILAITKITNDSINKKSLRPYLEQEIKQLNEEEQKNIGSIRLLSMFWGKYNLSQYEQYMTLMQNIQSVRSQGTAHRKSKKDYEKKAKDIGVTDNNFQEVISNILNNLADFFILIQNNIDNITF